MIRLGVRISHFFPPANFASDFLMNSQNKKYIAKLNFNFTFKK